MGFLCIIKNNEKIVSQDVIKETTLLRNLGLDNVYNINPEITICPEIFRSPEFYVSGATKLVSGLTTTLTGCTTGMTSVYNLDYTPDFNVNFIITGGTDYTGYTGDFCYKIFSDERFVVSSPIGGFIKGTEIIDNCIAFSAITSTTITEQFLEGGLPRTWAQYLIRPYYGFVTKECSPGLSFNTWDGAVQFNTFQNESDYYFMTVVNPPTPILAPPGKEPIPNYSFIQDNLLINGVAGQRGPQAINDTLNYFILKASPAADIMIFVNGVKMTVDFDYRVISRGFAVPPAIEFQFPIKRTDWITANYLVGTPSALLNSDFSTWFIDTFKVNVITVDTNPGYVNAVNSNTITGKQEIYLTQPIDKNNAIFLTINGVEMVENQQFFKSVSQDNRIILDNVAPIKIGDVISILAVSPNFIFGGNNYGSLPTPEFIIQWSVPSTLSENVTGRFIVQVFDKNDTFNTVLYQQTLPFEEGQANYLATITSIALNQYYRFRVTFESTYTAYLNNEVITCSYSEGYFDTSNRYINNTY